MLHEGVAGNLGVVELDAQPGTVGQVVVAVPSRLPAAHQRGPPGRVEVAEVLLHHHLRRGPAEVHGRAQRHRADGAVRGHAQVVGFAQRGDLAPQAQTAAVRQVELHDVAGAQGRQPREILQRVQALAGGHGEGQRLAHLAQLLQAVRRHRLLVPGRVEACQAAAHLDGRAHRQPAVHLDHQLHPGADRLAHGRHHGLGVVGLGRRQMLPGLAEGVELQATIAARHDLHRLARVVLRGERATVPAVGVHRQRLARAPAQQAPHRLAAGLADEVPAGDLQRADGRHHRAAALVLVADHLAEGALDVEGAGAQHARLGPFVDQRAHGLLLPLQRGLADAVQAVVGVQAHEQIVAQAAVGHQRLDADDLHAWVSGLSRRRRRACSQRAAVAPSMARWSTDSVTPST